MHTHTPAKRFAAGVVLLALGGLLAGCVSFKESPGPWTEPVPQPDQQCPSLTGLYENNGHAPQQKDVVRLACQFFVDSYGHCLPEASEVEQVRLDSQANALQVQALSRGKPVLSASFSPSQGGLVCTQGWLSIKNRSVVSGGSSAAGLGNTTRHFALSQGFLLEKTDSEGLMFFMVLPVHFSSTRWYRYAPLQP